jgi:hypothetical protein
MFSGRPRRMVCFLSLHYSSQPALCQVLNPTTTQSMPSPGGPVQGLCSISPPFFRNLGFFARKIPGFQEKGERP